MFQKAKHWDVKSIILLALIGILVGAVYQYGVDNFYNVIRLLFYQLATRQLWGKFLPVFGILRHR